MTRPRTAPEDPSGRFLTGLAFLAAVGLVVAVPLVWDSGALDMFRSPKGELALAAWGALAAIFVLRNPGGPAWRDPWWPAWGGVLAGAVVSALACPQPPRALVALVLLAIAAVGWGAVRQLPESGRRTLAALVVWSGVVEAALVLLFLRTSWRPTTYTLLAGLSGRYAWIGTLGNPADVGVFLVLPAVLATARAVGSRRLRLSNGTAAALMVAVILGTRTMTAFAALAAAALVLVWTRAPRPRRVAAAAATLAVALLVVVATPLAERVRGAVRQTRTDGLLWLGSGRFAAYAAGASMLGARPLAGVGFGLFEANSFRFQSLDALAERGRLLGLETAFGEAHNDILQYGAETGIVGLLLAGAGLTLAARRRSREGGVAVGAWPLTAAALVLLLTQFPLHLAPVAAQWAILAALALPALPAPPAAGVWAERLRVLAAGCLIGAALVAIWRLHRAETILQQAKLLSATLRAADAPPQRRQEIARAALANVVPKLRWLPYSWSAALIAGNLAVDAGDTRAALASFDRALALAERPEVQFDVGVALRQAGDPEAGLEHLLRAVQLNPAIFREIRDPDLARAVRRRLDESGYGARHAWMYEASAAANP